MADRTSDVRRTNERKRQRLVAHHPKQFGIAHQRSGNGEHLLLATRKVFPLLFCNITEHWEMAVDPVQIPLRITVISFLFCDFQVLPNRQCGENPAVVRHPANA